MSDQSQVFRDAMGLSIEERARLAAKLLASLDELDEKESERLWAEESRRRLAEHDAGRARSVPAEEVAKKAAGMLR